eukprot:1160979-Pelagomonas_calceolata.AAC.2
MAFLASQHMASPATSFPRRPSFYQLAHANSTDSHSETHLTQVSSVSQKLTHVSSLAFQPPAELVSLAQCGLLRCAAC